MKADAKDIALLLELQHIDIETMRARKKLDELPQRAKILEIRKKKEAVEVKRDQILAMKKEGDLAVLRIGDEDERLAAKQSDTQMKIDESKGDYRSVEALSKDLNGIMKRRVTLDADLTEAQAKLEQILAVKKQIDEALEALVTQENTLISSFQKEGGALNTEVAEMQKRRGELEEALPEELLEAYDRTAKRSGGIAVARMQHAACSVCRNAITDGKLLQVQAEAPLSTCPSCKRMLVVVE